jgi:surfactin synthase thioesterase subunit
MTGGSWLMPWHPQPDRCPVLLCLPPAGAGCGQFRSWQAALGGSVSVIGVQLPGRENRWADPDPSSVSGVVDAVVAEVAELVPPSHPIVVFGHSFGALLGYEIARSLRAGRDQRLLGLVVAACIPPGCWADAGLGLINEKGELARLLDARGFGADDLDEDTREVMLDVLSRDARLSLSFTGDDLTAVDCPLEAWGGAEDMIVSAGDLPGWRDYAAQTFRARLFPGGHYFCLDDPQPALALLGPMTVPAGEMKGTAR